jgi:hypothetical protein
VNEPSREALTIAYIREKMREHVDVTVTAGPSGFTRIIFVLPKCEGQVIINRKELEDVCRIC